MQMIAPSCSRRASPMVERKLPRWSQTSPRRGALIPLRLYPTRRRVFLQCAQEIENVLLLTWRQSIEFVHHSVGFRVGEYAVAEALMCLDCLQKISRSAIVQKENSLAQAPQRRRPELIWSSLPLDDVVRQPGPHVVHQQIGEKIRRLVAQGRTCRRPRGQRRRVAES